jgi:hypothetical protein
MGATEVELDFDDKWEKPVFREFEEEIRPEDIEIVDNLLTFKGEIAICYIRDQSTRYKEYKFHICDCETIEKFKMQKRFDERYVATNRNDGHFTVNVVDELSKEITKEGIQKELKICKNCLKRLNYKNYNIKNHSKQNAIFNDFNIEEFFETYGKRLSKMPKHNEHNAPVNKYSENFDDISYNFRASKNWKCEKCGRDFSERRNLLHTHHLNGNKADNSPGNLRALCNDCHSREPGHEHMML